MDAPVRLPPWATLFAYLPRGARLAAPLLRMLGVPPVPIGVGGVRLLLDPGGTHQLGLLRTRNFDAMKAAIVLASVKPGDLFVDVGANWGYFTILAAKRGARVLAVEVDASARSEWCRAVALNGVSALLAPYAAVEREGPVMVDRPWFRHNAVVGHGGAVAHGTTVDTLACGQRVSFLKIDAEGRDLSVLLGARRVLTEDRPTVIVECGGNWPAIRDLMRGYGYRATVVEEKPGRLRLPKPGEDVAWDVLFEPIPSAVHSGRG